MIRTVLFWKIFCPGQKNFRKGFAKLKYRWLQSSRLKMSRYSLFCVYCTECKPSRYNRLAVARRRIIPSSYGLKSKYPKGCFLFCARSIMIAQSANRADIIGLPSQGAGLYHQANKIFCKEILT